MDRNGNYIFSLDYMPHFSPDLVLLGFWIYDKDSCFGYKHYNWKIFESFRWEDSYKILSLVLRRAFTKLAKSSPFRRLSGEFIFFSSACEIIVAIHKISCDLITLREDFKGR